MYYIVHKELLIVEDDVISVTANQNGLIFQQPIKTRLLRTI